VADTEQQNYLFIMSVIWNCV